MTGNMNSGTRALVFVHIPKCGGTTFNRALRLQCESPVDIALSVLGARHTRSLAEETRDVERKVRRGNRSLVYFTARHYAFGSHELLDVPVAYATMLRDPVERLLSSYYFGAHGRADLEEFVRKGLDDGRLYLSRTDNVMTRFLAGEKGRGLTVPIGECTDDMLRLAMKRLGDDIAIAGILEKPDDSAVLMRDALGLRNFRYVTANVARARPRRDEIPSRTMELIEHYNELDIALYNHAVALLEQRIADADDAYPDRVARFRKSNAIYNRLMQPAHGLFTAVRAVQARRHPRPFAGSTSGKEE